MRDSYEKVLRSNSVIFLVISIVNALDRNDAKVKFFKKYKPNSSRILRAAKSCEEKVRTAASYRILGCSRN